jgi:hypothetical protein
VTSLHRAQQDASEHALRQSVRALRERELLLRRVAAIATATGDRAQAQAGLAAAERLHDQIRSVIAMADTLGPGAEGDADA